MGQSMPAGKFSYGVFVVFFVRSFDEISGGLPLSVFFQYERDGFNRGLIAGK